MSGSKIQVLVRISLVIGFLAGDSDCYGMNTGTINVSATVAASCRIDQLNDINFTTAAGNYTGNSIRHAFSNTIQFTCTSGSNYATQLDFGQNSPPSSTSRRMRNGSDFLTYQIFSDAGYSQIWGMTVGVDTNPINRATAGVAQISQTAYGEIIANQVAAVGTYTDQLTATVNFN